MGKCNMNIVRFAGGLGNQMFQYALYRAFEINTNSKVIANISFYEDIQDTTPREFQLLKVFPNISLHIDETDLLAKKRMLYLKIYKRMWMKKINYSLLPINIFFREKESAVFDKRIFQLRNSAIYGYWQTEKYFKNISSILRNDFCFKEGDAKVEEFASVLKDNKNCVSVHVRRGDYLHDKYKELYGNICTREYYQQAVNYIKDHVERPKFIFFSDDIERVESQFGNENAIFVSVDMFEKYEDWYDMYLMSCCTHNIIANSSFSWWGAWLNNNPDKIVIAPGKWLNGKSTDDIWCEGWVRF